MPDLLHLLGQPRGLPKKAFKKVQREMLDRFAELAESIYEQKRSAVLVFEGWDAAGKGTTIRALTERLDARGYKVLATQAPRTHEKQKPWLWRFWMNIPRYGQIAIFDRSWYGRVLVERVRGLTPAPEWIAAYEEINQFEHTLADDGAIFVKFWLHISRHEQLRRFIELAQEPATAWQVTAEDWENHRRYDEYVAAVRDMLANTSTPYAPWAAIDATNREHRLYSVCRTLIGRLEESLGAERSQWPEPEELDVFDAAEAGREAAPSIKSKKEKKKAKEAAAGAADVKAAANASANGLAVAGSPAYGAVLAPPVTEDGDADRDADREDDEDGDKDRKRGKKKGKQDKKKDKKSKESRQKDKGGPQTDAETDAGAEDDHA